MKKIKWCLAVFLLLCGAVRAEAKVDLVTLPSRDAVQLTIYNSADLTLARESRALTLKEGLNELQFSWANTLIDPTSLEMMPLAKAGQIDIQELVYPPRVKDVGVWRIQSALSGRVPIEINYLTSGLSWRAFYLGTLDAKETTMRLKGYVRVTNQSGEDYAQAQVRLIVGKVHILDQIAALAQRQYPYGRPQGEGRGAARGMAPQALGFQEKRFAKKAMRSAVAGNMQRKKEIVKEGLSEYFLYTIEGTETIPNGWSKRLPSFDVKDIDVVNLYKYEEERYGRSVMRFLSFKNDEAHQLGETPIPGGMIKVFRQVDAAGHLSYEGQSRFKYIPVGEDVELNLGEVKNVVVEATLMEQRTENYSFDRWRNIDGWEEVRAYEIEVKNTRDVPVKIEIQRNMNTTYWDIRNEGLRGDYEKVDKDTVKYTVTLKPQEDTVFRYVLRTYHGTRQGK
jgi:hypothetical protein